MPAVSESHCNQSRPRDPRQGSQSWARTLACASPKQRQHHAGCPRRRGEQALAAAGQSQPAIDSARPPFFTSDEYSSRHTPNLTFPPHNKSCHRAISPPLSPILAHVLSNHCQSSQRWHQQHSDNSFGCQRPPHRARQGVVSRQKSECAPRVPGQQATKSAHAPRQ